MKNRNVVILSAEHIRGLFSLKDNHRIVDIIQNSDNKLNDTYSIIISGDCDEVLEGSVPVCRSLSDFTD